MYEPVVVAVLTLALVSGYSNPPFDSLVTARNGTSLRAPSKNSLFLCDTTAQLENGTVVEFPKVLQSVETPWVEGQNIILSRVPVVNGSNEMKSEFEMTVSDTERRMRGNGIPNHPMGTFPIPENTLAYSVYGSLPAEGYSNAAEIPTLPYNLDITVPRYPVESKDGPFCITPVLIGVATQTGATWHLEYAADASYQAVDPNAALFTDLCWGHPYETQYHYHGYSWKCFPDQGASGEHSPLYGYALDGFGIYGPFSENYSWVTNEELDECHGHKHEIEWEGDRVNMYHYHLNNEYPYSIGCYKGKPAVIDPNQTGQVSLPLSYPLESSMTEGFESVDGQNTAMQTYAGSLLAAVVLLYSFFFML